MKSLRRRQILPVAIVLGFLLLCILMPAYRLSGDARQVVMRVAAQESYPTNLGASWASFALDSIPGVGPRDAVMGLSFLAGILYAVAAIGIGRTLFPDPTRRSLTVLLLLTSRTAILFFGTIEVYAPLVSLVAVYLWVALRAADGRGSAWLPPPVLGLAMVMHGSAAFLVPSLLLARPGGWRTLTRPLRLAATAGLFLLPIAMALAVLYFVVWGGEPPYGPLRFGSTLDELARVPILPLRLTPTNVLHRYAILDGAHLLAVLKLWILVSPVGWFLLLSRRRPWEDRRFRLLVLSGVLLFLLPLVWKVAYEVDRDWDLFAAMGVPIAAAAAVAGLHRPPSRRTVLWLSVSSLLVFAALLLWHRGGHSERLQYHDQVIEGLRIASLRTPDRADDLERLQEEWRARLREEDVGDSRGHLREAQRLAEQARWREAIAEFRIARAADPGNDRLLSDLAGALARIGERNEARTVAEESLSLSPGNLDAALVVVNAKLRGKDLSGAILTLERAIRFGLEDTNRFPAVLTLADLRERNDQPGVARDLRALAAAFGYR